MTPQRYHNSPASHPGNQHAVRAIFWLHALTAAYCISFALLDAGGLLPAWLSPGIAVFYALFLSVALFPLAALLVIRRSGDPHHGGLEFAHVLMSFAQFLGLILGCA